MWFTDDGFIGLDEERLTTTFVAKGRITSWARVYMAGAFQAMTYEEFVNRFSMYGRRTHQQATTTHAVDLTSSRANKDRETLDTAMVEDFAHFGPFESEWAYTKLYALYVDIDRYRRTARDLDARATMHMTTANEKAALIARKDTEFKALTDAVAAIRDDINKRHPHDKEVKKLRAEAERKRVACRRLADELHNLRDESASERSHATTLLNEANYFENQAFVRLEALNIERAQRLLPPYRYAPIVLQPRLIANRSTAAAARSKAELVD
jgi:hypothetical protein